MIEHLANSIAGLYKTVGFTTEQSDGGYSFINY